MDERVVLNVGGNRFEVSIQTLRKLPDSLLGKLFDPENPQDTVRPDKNGEYFFDRNGRIFELILDIYRTGKLCIPAELSEALVKKELAYFQIELDPEDIEYAGRASSRNEVHEEEEEPEEEDDEDIFYNLPKEKRLGFAVSLIHKNDRQKTIKGVSFLLEILEEIEQATTEQQQPSAEMSSLRIDCLYQLAFGYYRLGNNTTAKKYLSKLLEVKPGSTKAKALVTLINDTSSSFAKTGFLFATAVVIAAFVGYRYYRATSAK